MGAVLLRLATGAASPQDAQKRAVHSGEVEVTGAQGVKVTLREGQESVVKRGVASPPRRASKGSLEEDRGDLLIWLKRAWQRLLGNLDQAVGQ